MQWEQSLGRWTTGLAGFGVTACLLGPLAAHFELVDAMAGFLLFDLGGLVAIFSLALAIVALSRGPAAVRHAALPGFVGALLIIGLFVGLAGRARDYPRINDISTDTDNPPQFVAIADLPANQSRDMRYPGETFASQQKAAYPDLAALAFRLTDPDHTFRVVAKEADRNANWTIVRSDSLTRTIEGYETSWLFRFKDDFVIDVRPADAPTGSVVHMRSKSRDGKGDLGINAARIRAFFAVLHQLSLP